MVRLTALRSKLALRTERERAVAPRRPRYRVRLTEVSQPASASEHICSISMLLAVLDARTLGFSA